MTQNIILVLTTPPQPFKTMRRIFSWQAIQKRAMGWSLFANPCMRGSSGQPPTPVNNQHQKIKLICGHSTLLMLRLKTSNCKDSMQLKITQTIS